MQPFKNVDTIRSCRSYKQMARRSPGATVRPPGGVQLGSANSLGLKPGYPWLDPVSTPKQLCGLG